MRALSLRTDALALRSDAQALPMRALSLRANENSILTRAQ